MTVVREDKSFGSGAETCAAWVYRAEGGGPRPAVIMGHGLAGTREMGLDAYAQRFAAAGITVIVFDYRYFGDSTGEPRRLLSIPAQLADWDAAIAFAKGLDGVDPQRIAVWGSSFGGGHVMVVAAKHPELSAAVSQCPFTDGPASSFALGPRSTLKVGPRAVADEIGALLGREPVRLPVAGPPGSAALMTAPDVVPGYERLMPPGKRIPIDVAARLGTRILWYRPGAKAKKVRIPMLVDVCLRDTVAPARPTLSFLKKATTATVRRHDLGHFDIYVGGGFDQVIDGQVTFLTEHLKP